MWFVAQLGVVRMAHKTDGNYLTHFLVQIRFKFDLVQILSTLAFE
jgi:hypothetical protein